MKINNISYFKECMHILFSFFETNNIPCLLGSLDELKESMDLVYEAELVSWECEPSYPSLSIDFTISCDFECEKVFNFLFRDTGSQGENSVLIDLSSRDNSVSFIRFEIHSSRHLPFVPGLPESMGSMEARESDGQVEYLDEINAGDSMSLEEFGAFLSRHPVPGELTLVEVD